MNSKIQELQLAAMARVFNGSDPDGDIERMYIPREFARVFAELVAQHCADLCLPEQGLKYSPNSASSRNDCREKILATFGAK